MTKTCGDYGGKNGTCGRPAGWGVEGKKTGKCKDHINQKPIDWGRVKNMSLWLCSLREIAGELEIPKSTLHENEKFKRIHKKARMSGKRILRQMLYKKAQKSSSVLIFMAKNHLGMSDNPEHEKEEVDTLEKFAAALKNNGVKARNG
ncbi:MAG: hypothetical protein R6U11_04630 [Bacteroidales bacterium]